MWPSSSRAPRGANSKPGQGQGRRGRASPPSPPTPPPGGYRILVLVGIPGSGKSTFSSFLEDLGWTTVSQDALGSRKKCRRRAQEVLQRGGRVAIDRCNFDQSQRVTWIDLAVSLSLHEDACIAVWLDVDIGVCQERVRSRVGHRTLGPGRASAGIVKMVAGDLRPPHRKEGFHAVLRCKGGDQQSLSDAVALLSGIQGSGGHDVGAPPPPRRPPPEMALASSALASRGGDHAGGGVGDEWGGGEPARTAWGQSAGVGGGALPADHAWEPFPADSGFRAEIGMEMMPGAAAAAAGFAFPADAAFSPDAAFGTVSTPKGEGGNESALAWGAGPHQQVGVEGFGGSAAVGMRGGAASDTIPAGAHNADLYPPLPGGDNGKHARRFNGRIGKDPPQPMGYRSSSLSSIARLAPKKQAEASAAHKQQPQKTKTRLLTPAEISTISSDLQTPPRVIAPQDVALTSPTRKAGPSKRVKQRGKRHDPRAESIPLGPSSLQEWTSRATGSAHDGRDPRQSEEQAASAAAAPVDGDRDSENGGSGGSGRGGGGDGDVSSAAAREDKEGLGLSDGETYFVLEDMFGGLLLPKSLEQVFRESGNNLEKAVQDGFRLLEATAAEMFHDAPSTSTGASTDWSSSETHSETQDESDGEFADVSEWTHNQVETLTDLCLAFEGTYTRENIIAALIASHHDATSAAQLLLDTAASSSSDQKPPAGGKETSNRRRRFGAATQNSNTGGVTAAATAAAATLLGATCGGEKRPGGNGGGGEGRASGEEGEGEEEEEEGDEGLSSEEYRACANEAAEQMKTWFQKAAEAYTRGGRKNGGAAAADPSRNGQRWKKKMEAVNLRAARETFRERNPLVRVGYTNDGVSVLKVLALPRSSQCSTPGRLSIDLHLLRRAEALLVLEAVLRALARRNALFDRLPHRRDRSRDAPEGRRRFASEANQDRPVSGAAAAAGEGVTGKGVQDVQNDRNYSNLYSDRFTSLEVVVGRGAHSVAGVPRLRPCVVGYLAGKRLRAEAVEGDRGKGVVVVRLDNP